jgi:hypothetical protein
LKQWLIIEGPIINLGMRDPFSFCSP